MLPKPGPPPAPDATLRDADSDLSTGSLVGEYQIQCVLGRGAMGIVYGAVQPLIRKQVAVKVISEEMSQRPDAVARFVKEARAVNQIGHPNIVDVFAFGKLPNGRPYLVMEWLRGETLAAHLARERLPLGEQLEILDQVSDALEAAHRQGVIHRDLKPDNVFLSPSGGAYKVKLLDFGIAKLTQPDTPPESATTSQGALLGTPFYFSPEQARGKGADARSDIYSLGVLAFQIATRRLPFHADNVADVVAMQLAQPPPAPSSFWPEVPPLLERLILKMLDKDPDRRPTWLEIRAALAQLRRQLAAVQPTQRMLPLPVPPKVAQPLLPNGATGPARSARTSRQRSLWVGMVGMGAGAAAIAMLLAVLGHRGQRQPERPAILRAPIAAASPPLVLSPAKTTGSILLRGELSDAAIALDDRPTAAAKHAGARVVEVEAGLHRIEVTAPQGRFQKLCQVEPGSSVELLVQLVPLAPPHPRRHLHTQEAPNVAPPAPSHAPTPARGVAAPLPPAPRLAPAPAPRQRVRDSLVDPFSR